MFRFIILLVLFLVNFVLVNSNNCEDDCFSDSSKSCENVNEPKCFISTIYENTVVCCHLNDTNLDEYLISNTTFNTERICYLHILNSDFNNFTLNMRGWLKNLKSLAVTNGRMTEFNPIVKKMSKLKCLNLTSNSLINMGSLQYAGMLRTLDLSNNSLPDIPDIPKLKIKIDMSDNPLSCDDINTGLKSLKYTNFNFENPNSTWCMLTPNKQDWFKVPSRLMLSELEKLTQNQTDCPHFCHCRIFRVDTSNSKAGKLWTTVNCSNIGLQELPTRLPENCFSLDVSYNNISSLKLIHDISYDSLSELYAHHSNITSIDELEGSKFILNFSRLDLRYNNITSISTHLFRYAFDRASHRELSLGYNYVECDCNVAKNLKSWLLFNDIKDHEEVFCLDKVKVKVINLDLTELCREDPSLTDYIYYIIAAEVLLLTLLIAKVSYDYWIFKGTGYLPWPASKMPKLPCDWLCE